jgi:hypothetical protein
MDSPSAPNVVAQVSKVSIVWSGLKGEIQIRIILVVHEGQLRWPLMAP